MNETFIKALEQLYRDKGISKELVFDAIEQALIKAFEKNVGTGHGVRVELDRESGDLKVFVQKLVVEGLPKSRMHVTLTEAKQYKADVEPGEHLEVEISSEEVARTAAQTARQTVMQKIREAEREGLYNEFKEREGSLVIGTVQRFEKGATIVDLTRVEAVLDMREAMPRERFRQGDRLKAYLMEVRQTNKGPLVRLSRACAGFIERLFEAEIPEIQEEIVKIISVSREPGSRTKIAVASDQDRVDPVGACVGLKGSRIQQIVNELHGEKIDIIRWSKDMGVYVSNALQPAKVISIKFNEEKTEAEVIVPDHQLSLAIGREGQNVRLAARLTGCKIDIISESKNREKLQTMLILDRQKREEAKAKAEEAAESAEEIVEVGEIDLGLTSVSSEGEMDTDTESEHDNNADDKEIDEEPVSDEEPDTEPEGGKR